MKNEITLLHPGFLIEQFVQSRIPALLIFLMAFLGDGRKSCADWAEAAGPNKNYCVPGTAPNHFSVAENESVLWRVSLPNTGESTPIISGDRVFLTCHTAMKQDAESGRDILGLCFDARSGKELWRRRLPAYRITDMASGFSDNTAASPVTDGKYVCFINVGGSIQTYDFNGKLIWQRQWVPFGRHHARQQEPILCDGNVIFVRTVAENLPVAATTKSGAKPLGRGDELWTRLHAYNLETGDLAWIADAASSVHSLSMLAKRTNGEQAILTGRGGGHQPPEEPYGLSLINATTGKTVWDLPWNTYHAHQNSVWRNESGFAFVGMEHHHINMETGQIKSAISLNRGVDVCRFQKNKTAYAKEENINLVNDKQSRPITYHTNCLVGNYHFFRSHQQHLIGRVDIARSKVEYLEVPVQVVRGQDKESWLWGQALQNDGRNQDGFIVYQDRRATLDGWGHVSAASPIVVGDYLYMPTMLGTVYVLKWNAEHLDETALQSISDLGPAGQTWSLSSLSFDKGRLFARTMKELVCIGNSNP